MAIFVTSHKLCFIHNPKTAGSSIQSWLLKNTDCTHWKLHCTLDQAKEKFPNIKYSFAVVRNPWDWAVSSYFYEYKKIEHNLALINDKPHLINTNKDKYNIKVQHQKKNFLDNGFEYWLTNGHITPQNKFLDVDYVLKFENLHKDFQKIQQMLFVEVPLPHINKTKKEDYKTYYTNSDIINYVYNKYNNEITKFGYKYETP